MGKNLVLPSLDLLILQEIIHSLMFSRMVWVLLPSQTCHCLDLLKLLFSLVLPDPVEPSQEDTHSQLKLRIPMNVIENSTLKSKTAVVLCLEFSVLCVIQLDSCDHHFFYPITHN